MKIVIVLLTELIVFPWDIDLWPLLLQAVLLRVDLICLSSISWALVTLRAGVSLCKVLTILELKGRETGFLFLK